MSLVRWILGSGSVNSADTPPPQITVIGEVGVGKSSTINAMFRTNLPVGQTLSIQTQPKTETVPTPRGDIVVTDMPGLGETIDKTREYLKYYRKILPGADVVLWIITPDKRLEAIQLHLKEVRRIISAQTFRRIVFCLNKVDMLRAGAWIPETNQPDTEREAAIDTYAQWVAEVLKIDSETIVPYSAELFYNLDAMLVAMLDAVPANHQLAFKSRVNPRSPTEKMTDPSYRERSREIEEGLTDALERANDRNARP